ncbi:MAG: helix-turn-helix transcriptional regulator [Lachnospiraceae bacterium]|nr:helix-turn-helix transcriptional regulator [Lachnospiraceae bacterium]
MKQRAVAGKRAEHTPFFPSAIRKLLNESGQTPITVLSAPDNYGKKTFAAACAAQYGLKTLYFEIIDDDSEEVLWDRFRHFLDEGRIPGNALPQPVQEVFASSGAQNQNLADSMRRCAAEARKLDHYGCALVVDHAERQKLPAFRAFLESFAKHPAGGWHIFLLYEDAEAPQDILQLKHVMRIGTEDLRLHAEDIYEMFLHAHIPVTIESVVSLYQHSGGAIGEVAEVLKLQENKESSLTLLTPRELEIASMASSGLTNREIAERLYISENTVKSAMKNIFSRLHITSRRRLISMINPETRMR